MNYEAWRITYQDPEQACRALRNENTTLRAKLQAAEAENHRLRFSLSTIEKRARYHGSYGSIIALCEEALTIKKEK